MILAAVNFNILAEIPSDPLVFDTSKDTSRWNISSSVQKSSIGETVEDSDRESVKGRWEVLAKSRMKA